MKTLKSVGMGMSVMRMEKIFHQDFLPHWENKCPKDPEDGERLKCESEIIRLRLANC